MCHSFPSTAPAGEGPGEGCASPHQGTVATALPSHFFPPNSSCPGGFLQGSYALRLWSGVSYQGREPGCP